MPSSALFICLLLWINLVVLTPLLVTGLKFETIHEELRVAADAPIGTVIGQLSVSGATNVTYSLHKSSDYHYFHLDPRSGILKTHKIIDRPANSTYRIIAKVTTWDNKMDNEIYEIRVTRSKPSQPQFTQEEYRGELDTVTPIGATIIQAQANVNDRDWHNKKLHYSLEPFADDSGTSIRSFKMDSASGIVTLNEPIRIGVRRVQFYIVAKYQDWPSVENRVLATIIVKTLSEPRDVKATHTNASMAVICWNGPESGHPKGYSLQYSLADRGESSEMREINTTMPNEYVQQNNETIVQLNGAMKEPTLCANLQQLRPNSSYTVQVYGWDTEEISPPSATVNFSTLPDYCLARDICVNGQCQLKSEQPGYQCLCHSGFYGDRCQYLNRCILNPCENAGLCRNLSNGEYHCTCIDGYYGSTCSFFDPCAAKIAPCLNNGTCSSTANQSLLCTCANGYFGAHCEHFDPCSNHPCQNMASCVNVSSTVYSCQCPAGYEGQNCERMIDLCSSEPCQNDGKCTSQLNNYECRCPDGFHGKNCELDVDECLSSPCQNGYCQKLPGSFVCDCYAGFTGHLCESDIDECQSSPCLNNGVCQDRMNNYTCHCRPGYGGPECQINLDDCEPDPCTNGGTCIDEVNAFSCICPIGFGGLRCDIEEQCSGEIQNTSRGIFHWEILSYGQTARIPCPFGGVSGISVKQRVSVPVLQFDPYVSETFSIGPDKISKRAVKRSSEIHPSKQHGMMKDAEYRRQSSAGSSWREIQRMNREEKLKHGENGVVYAVRSCEMLADGSVEWMPPDFSLCREELASQAEEKLVKLEMSTEDEGIVNADELEKTAVFIENVVEYAVQDPRVAQSMVNVLSNVLEVDNEIIESSDVGEKVLDVMQRFTSSVNLQRGQEITLSTPNIAVKTVLLDIHSNQTGMSSYSFKPQFGTMRSRRENLDETIYNSSPENQISLTIPEEALQSGADEDGTVRLQFISFRNSKLFRSRGPMKGNPGIVLTAVLGNKTISGLKIPVTYSIPFTEQSSFYSCVYWMESAKEWSTNGLSTNATSSGILCSSDHLTAFSVLLDPSPSAVSSYHERILSLISYIGSGLSILGLSITVILYSLFRNLRRDRSGKILVNLCLSLLLLNVVFLVGSGLGSNKTHHDRKEALVSDDDGRIWIPGLESNKMNLHNELCLGLAISVHYLVLASLFWMLVEAIHMYQLLITVFANSESYFMVKRMAAAWGIPAVVVAITALIDLDFYQDPESEFCRITPRYPAVYYGAFIGPVCLMLLVNFIVFIMVLRVILLQGQRGRAVGKVGCIGSDRWVTLAQIRGAITVMALLGITWIFGALAIGRVKLIMQYVFCVTNSLQGFIIFIVRVVQYPEARFSWMTLLRTGKTQTRFDGMRHSSGPTTHSSTSTHCQARHTLSCSTQITSQSANPLTNKSSFYSNSHTRTEASVMDGAHDSYTPSEAPTLAAEASLSYHKWYARCQRQDNGNSELAPNSKTKEASSSRLNFRRILGQFRLEPSFLKPKDLLKSRSSVSHTLLERHVSGATNPPPSPGEKAHNVFAESITENDDLVKPNFLIGKEITFLPLQLQTSNKSQSMKDINNGNVAPRRSLSGIETSIVPESVPVVHRIIDPTEMGGETPSRRSSLIKEGADTSWTFLRPMNEGKEERDGHYQLGKGSTPILKSAERFVISRRRSASASILPRVSLQAKEYLSLSPNGVEHVASPCKIFHDFPRLDARERERRAMSLNEGTFLHQVLSEHRSLPLNVNEDVPSCVVIAGQRITVSRSPSKAL